MNNSVSFKLLENNKPALIIGGSGFIGTNLAHRLLSLGKRVKIFDNLSRPGVEENLRWLKEKYGDSVIVEIGDVRDKDSVVKAVQNVSHVFNFAAQVAVTTSLTDPVKDFEVNVCGTINILEALRALDREVPLIFTSTNKVYGSLTDIKMQEKKFRYQPAKQRIKRSGINEMRNLDFQSPYGCSKGAADQYILDYTRSFGLQTAVFRMSCIYGPHQFGTEDQGWVAHFLIQALKDQSITIFGNGKQVRDILFVEDLVDALLIAADNTGKITGEAFNIGGGPSNAISLIELIKLIEVVTNKKVDVLYGDWRTGDQKYYVTDTAKFTKVLGWTPRIDTVSGIEKLYEWLLTSDVLKSAHLHKAAAGNRNTALAS